MQQQIEKLKLEREKLATEFKNNQIEYKSEIKKIDRAIKSFEKGMNVLTGITKPKRQKSYSEIENILSENGALHIKELVKKLNERGFPMTYPSVSGLLQLYAKANKKFVKTAPATYSLLKPEMKFNDEANQRTIVYETDSAESRNRR